MITDKDVQKLIKAFKVDFATKKDLEELEARINRKFNSIMSSVDALAKHMETYHQGIMVMRHRMERIGKWIKEASKKNGVAYKV
ncbi:MAG: hypothetical protein COT92_02860 [Candidatus Doudnabacteria bacterium CG10_big_fil_rev_8_21_14_0_10_42_18]|uniref:Uncharacterized protein n=1 Tax=Candidatus Doudnabacteria bacterium CG10_big_fil_rev_8_21_14_0_10_42_18 TaxID=1974552 RepID=A0A2H0VAN2_9BACT|nr:MAG: hypothetical protein COT92_02860 [Candidatus Doudnabacteria bacterium CG10_big_fil_rev_8_21_14_0_10_42_18]